MTNALWLIITVAQATDQCEFRPEGQTIIDRRTDNAFCNFSFVLEDHVARALEFGVEAFVIVVELSLYYVIWQTLKTQLNHYYLKTRKNLIILTITSITFFIFQLVRHIPWRFFNVQPDRIYYEGNFPNPTYTTGEFVIWMLIDLATYAPLFFHAYFNVKNINFKIYIKDIMGGYGVNINYSNCSIFLMGTSLRKKVPSSWIDHMTTLSLSSKTESVCFEEMRDSNSMADSPYNQNAYKQAYLNLKSFDEQVLLSNLS